LAQPVLAYQQQVQALSNDVAGSIVHSGKHRVAVVDFTDLQGSILELGRFLAEEVSVDLAQAALGDTAERFEVIDRTHLRSILQEHKLAATGLIDPQTARRLGEIAGVEALVTGTITPFGESVRLSVKLLDTESAKIFGASTADIPKTQAIQELLARGVGTSGGSISGSGGSPSISVPGLQSVEQDGWLFAARGCLRSGGEVTCTGFITNKSLKRRSLGVSEQSYLLDDLGNQYPAEGTLLGAKNGYQELEPDLPMKFTVTVKEVEPSATSIAVVLVYSSVQGVNWATSQVSLRSIRLSPR
jgi:TolB-like protein